LFLYAIFCAEISWRDGKRWAAILGGLAMVFIWFALLRHTPHLYCISPVIPWAMVVVTVIATAWLKRRLSPVSVDAGSEKQVASLVDVPVERDTESVAAR